MWRGFAGENKRRGAPFQKHPALNRDATAQHVRGAGAMTLDVTSRSSTAASGAEKLEMPHAIGRATTLVMAIGCGVVVATVYANQPMLGIMEAAFPGHAWITDLVPMATQLGFAVGLLLLLPLGNRVERRSLILLQLTAFALSLAAAAL
jgi:hypothetical protein